MKDGKGLSPFCQARSLQGSKSTRAGERTSVVCVGDEAITFVPALCSTHHTHRPPVTDLSQSTKFPEDNACMSLLRGLRCRFAVGARQKHRVAKTPDLRSGGVLQGLPSPLCSSGRRPDRDAAQQRDVEKREIYHCCNDCFIIGTMVTIVRSFNASAFALGRFMCFLRLLNFETVRREVCFKFVQRVRFNAQGRALCVFFPTT